MRGLGICLLALLPVACGHSGPPWALKDVSGLMPDLSFTMTDADTGNVVHAADFHGKVTLLYFGYTHCPDVCPTTLSKLSLAVAGLGAKANQARILFVTVDPKRDTVAGLKAYGQAFSPEVVGLRGTKEALRELTKRYRVTYGYGKPDANGDYEVSHSSAVYIFDPQGHIRLLARPTDSARAIMKDLKRLVAEG